MYLFQQPVVGLDLVLEPCDVTVAAHYKLAQLAPKASYCLSRCPNFALVLGNVVCLFMRQLQLGTLFYQLHLQLIHLRVTPRRFNATAGGHPQRNASTRTLISSWATSSRAWAASASNLAASSLACCSPRCVDANVRLAGPLSRGGDWRGALEDL